MTFQVFIEPKSTDNQYSRYPIFQAVPGKLSWAHLVEIIRINNLKLLCKTSSKLQIW